MSDDHSQWRNAAQRGTRGTRGTNAATPCLRNAKHQVNDEFSDFPRIGAIFPATGGCRERAACTASRNAVHDAAQLVPRTHCDNRRHPWDRQDAIT